LKEEYKVASVGSNYFDADACFQLSVSGEEKGKPALQVECIFTAHIHAKEPVSKELAKRFTDAELWIVMLPYVRQFVTNITAQMVIPPIVIPLASTRP